MFIVYILRCADRTLYVGHTHDLAAREKAHNDGTAAAYTANGSQCASSTRKGTRRSKPQSRENVN